MTVFLSLLRRFPVWFWFLLAAIAWGGWQKHRATAAQKVHTEAVQAAAKDREAKLLADAAETARRLESQRSITHDARKKAALHAANADRAIASERELRARLAAISADAGASNPTTPDGSAANPATSAVLADMLGQCAQRLRVVAEYADSTRASGEACERSYEALTAPK